MDAADDVVRTRSKILFGNASMIAVGSHIDKGEQIFTSADVVAITGVPASTVHRLLGDLVTAGLLARLPRGPHERTQWYSRASHPFWAGVSALADAPLAQMTDASAQPRGGQRVAP